MTVGRCCAGQESRESLSALREALPRTWAPDGDAGGWEAGGTKPYSGPAFWPAAPVRRALLQHRPQVAQAAGQAIPWLEAKLASLLQQYNLSQVWPSFWKEPPHEPPNTGAFRLSRSKEACQLTGTVLTPTPSGLHMSCWRCGWRCGMPEASLPQVVDELRWLQSDLAEPRRCTAEETRAALIALARARTAHRQHAEQHTAQKDKVVRRRRTLPCLAL